jgi:cytochrome c-type biogenesis protein CcmH/NrfG
MMVVLFFIVLVVLFFLASTFIYAAWLSPQGAGSQKIKKSLPLILIVALAVFSGVWYFWAGSSAHIIHAEDDVALRQIALFLEDELPLSAAIQTQINAELASQTTRAGAKPTVWLLQAQLAMQQHNYAMARQAYALSHAFAPNDPDIAVSYAQSWYLDETATSEKKQISPELQDFLNKLQEQYPDQEGLINLLGVVAFHQGDYNKAIQYWQLLLTHYPAGSPESQALQSVITQAEQMAKNNQE